MSGDPAGTVRSIRPDGFECDSDHDGDPRTRSLCV